MDALTASPVIGNVYGLCGTSVMVEKGESIEYKIIPEDVGHDEHGRIPQDVLDKYQKDDVRPMNNLSPAEKLDIAISMAESLAEMHGLRFGAVTNDDISLDQWLISPDGRVILIDLNNANHLEWNVAKREYCPYYSSFPDHTLKPPEEYGDGGYVDTSVDVWPMGNLIFSLLTGLHPYYSETDTWRIQKKTMQGPPYLDPRYRTRSYIEGRMVKIMNQCHKLDPTERVEIFDVVRYLRETRDRWEAKEEENKRTKRK
jgi:serine/threonine protein kinase